MLILDAAGLALFAVSGAQKALAFHLSPVAAICLGMLTGIGGGILRDMLVSEVPTVLRSDLYAVAALAGATVVVIGSLLHLPPGLTTICGAFLCFWTPSDRDSARLAVTHSATGRPFKRRWADGATRDEALIPHVPYGESKRSAGVLTDPRGEARAKSKRAARFVAAGTY